MELIYYIRKPGSRLVLQEEVIKDDNIPTGEDGWYDVEYKARVRLSKGDPIAVVLSNGYNSVGYSVTSPMDQFDRKKGLMIARAREAYGFNTDHVPEFMKEHINIMLEKSRKTFGNK